MTLKAKIQELEKKFIELYNQALCFKKKEQNDMFFNADKEMQLITEELCNISGEAEAVVKENLLKQARENKNMEA